MEEKNYNEPDYFVCDGQKFAFDWKISQHPLDSVITYTEDWLHPPSKLFRCHSRKRFIKLIMSFGFSKRIANFLADFGVAKYGSYQIAYMHFAMINLIWCQI